jgi:hypothetical protein
MDSQMAFIQKNIFLRVPSRLKNPRLVGLFCSSGFAAGKIAARFSSRSEHPEKLR